MSYTVPYSFVPGTKARAQEVNANFAAIINSLGEIDENKVNLDLSNITSDGIDIIRNNSSLRNIGELVFSPVPLTDSNLHMLDGSLLQGDGIYGSFVDYIADKYNSNTIYNASAFTFIGTPAVTNDGIASGFSTTKYIKNDLIIPANSNYTIEGYITIGATDTNNIPFGLCGTGNILLLSLRIRPTDSGMVLVAKKNNNTNAELSTGVNTIISGQSYKYKIVINGSDLNFYFNDELKGSINNYNNVLTEYITFGIDRNLTQPFNGSIDLKKTVVTVNGEKIIDGGTYCNYFTDETTWQNTVNNFGECGKFVYDRINNTVRLPKINGLIQYTNSTSEAGDIVRAGLPNITGTYKDSTGRIGNYTSHSGAFSYKTATTNNFGDGANSSTHVTEINFDASRSSSIYGNSSTVQPQTVKYLVYIVVASCPKTNIQIDIDNIASDLNGKLDRDLTNMSGTNIKNFDGQWIYKHSVINNNVNLNAGKYDIDLSAYLPADQNSYEVIVNIYGSQNSSSSSSFVIISSGLITESGTTLSYSNFAVNSNSTVQGTQIEIPVGANRVLSYRLGGQDFDSLYIRLYGYRRIGSNN